MQSDTLKVKVVRARRAVIVERTSEGILLRPKREGRLSWDDTFRATGKEQRKKGDEFSEFNAVLT